MLLVHFPIENRQQISIWILKVSREPCVSQLVVSNIARKVAPGIMTLRVLFILIGLEMSKTHFHSLQVASLLFEPQ